MVRRALLGMVLALAACGGGGPGDDPAPAGDGAASTLPPPPATTNDNIESPFCLLAPEPQAGATEVGRERLSQRSLDITLESAAAKSQQHIVVVLPENYDSSGATRYPVLYLLHGALGGPRDYFDHGIEALVGGLPLIVVTPNSGSGNGYADSYGSVIGTGDDPTAWETHHLREVLPFVEANFPVRRDRAGRAIAGISMGGHGTLYYAGAHPELFTAAASISGAVDLTRDYPYYPVEQYATNVSSVVPGLGPAGYCTYGDFALQHGIWLDHDSPYVAANLRGIELWMSCGGGQPDGVPYVNSAVDPVELEVCEMTENLMNALDAQGIAYTADLYDRGTHDWSFWVVEIERMLPWLMQRLNVERAPPATFDFRSIKPRFSAWGWEFRAYRNVREFVYLSDVGVAGLDVIGSGTLDVITAPLYAAGRTYRVTAGSVAQGVTADGNGRLAFRLDLGPSHTMQQLQFTDADIAGWTHLPVTITAP